MNNSLWLILLLLTCGNCGNCGGGAVTIPNMQPVSPWCNPCMPQAPPQTIPSFPCEQQPMIIPSCQNTGMNNCEWIIILLLLFCNNHPAVPLNNCVRTNNMCC